MVGYCWDCISTNGGATDIRHLSSFSCCCVRMVAWWPTYVGGGEWRWRRRGRKMRLIGVVDKKYSSCLSSCLVVATWKEIGYRRGCRYILMYGEQYATKLYEMHSERFKIRNLTEYGHTETSSPAKNSKNPPPCRSHSFESSQTRKILCPRLATAAYFQVAYS